MILLPVIERELRVAARYPFTYHLRVLTAFALVVVFATFGLRGSIGPNVGAVFFGSLHCALFVAIWVLVPLQTADCISRERREDTLPLLFLTSLKPRDIVWAKGMAHGLRALTLWLAAVPVMTISFVAGGVGWAEVLTSALVNLSSICLAMAAGLVASCRTKVWSRAVALAVFLAAGGLLFLMFILPALLVLMIGTRRLLRALMHYGPLSLAVNWDGMWQQLLAQIGTTNFLCPFLLVTAGSVLLLLIYIRLAAWDVKRTWRQQPASARMLWWQEKLFRPVFFQQLLRRWLHWTLWRNPIGWLEQRSWSGRLVVWSWLAVVGCFYSSLFADMSFYQRGFHEVQVFLASLLVGSIALSAAGSFRRERESGLLELMLVAPLREWQIIAGRVRGLWGQFLPAIALLFGVWLYCATFMARGKELPAVLLFLVIFVTLPVVGLYFSLAKANVVAALVWTLLTQLVVPFGVGRLLGYVADPGYFGPASGLRLAAEGLVPPLLQILFAVYLAWRLREDLRYRRFSYRGGNS